LATVTAEEAGRYLRQSTLLGPEKLRFPVTVIGVGAIGSATAMTLSQMGCHNLTVYDGDLIELHNVSNQFCRYDYEGQLKVDSLKSIIKTLLDHEVQTIGEFFQEQHAAGLHGVVISGVDNMQIRKDIWNWIKEEPFLELYIDGRMASEIGEVFTVNPKNPFEVRFYEESLFPDEEGSQLPCTAQSIIFCPQILAGLIASQVKRFALGHRTYSWLVINLVGMGIQAAFKDKPEIKEDNTLQTPEQEVREEESLISTDEER